MLQGGEGPSDSCPVYYDCESVSGQVTIRVREGSVQRTTGSKSSLWETSSCFTTAITTKNLHSLSQEVAKSTSGEPATVLLVLDARPASDSAPIQRDRYVPSVSIPPSWIDLVLRENAHAWLKRLRPMTLTLRSRSPA
ncbi:hypothetical protein EDB86DRAFT_3080178 [Lactarius hatsudake]|nr:hypothetical protein EDB86DRAFT_3080178 [Lactarius hatsudake]